MAAADPSIDRLVDERTMMEAERGDVVVDGQLAGWVLKEISDLRILLTAPLVVRLERIAARDRISLEEARRQTLHREAVQAERYRKHYGFSVDDWSIYHLILDTSFGSIEDTAKILLAAALTAKNAKTRKTPERIQDPSLFQQQLIDHNRHQPQSRNSTKETLGEPQRRFLVRLSSSNSMLMPGNRVMSHAPSGDDATWQYRAQS